METSLKCLNRITINIYWFEFNLLTNKESLKTCLNIPSGTKIVCYCKMIVKLSNKSFKYHDMWLLHSQFNLNSCSKNSFLHLKHARYSNINNFNMRTRQKETNFSFTETQGERKIMEKSDSFRKVVGVLKHWHGRTRDLILILWKQKWRSPRHI